MDFLKFIFAIFYNSDPTRYLPTEFFREMKFSYCSINGELSKMTGSQQVLAEAKIGIDGECINDSKVISYGYVLHIYLNVLCITYFIWILMCNFIYDDLVFFQFLFQSNGIYTTNSSNIHIHILWCHFLSLRPSYWIMVWKKTFFITSGKFGYEYFYSIFIHL